MIKLLKYEFKATYKTFLMLFLGLYLACGAFGMIVRGGGIYAASSSIPVLFVMMIGIIVASIGVMTTITNIVRYKKNILGEEGYLMNTLPVPTWKLVLSKVLGAAFWSIVSIFVIVTAIIMSSFIAGENNVSQVWEGLKRITEIFGNVDIKVIVYMLGMFISVFNFYLTMYFAFSFGSAFNKNKVLIAFLFLILYKMILPVIFGNMFEELFIFVNQEFSILFAGGLGYLGVSNGVYVFLIFKIVEFIVFFFGTSYILKNKLNLE